MGLCSSKTVTFVPLEGVPGQDSIACELFEKLKLAQPELDRYYQAYCDIDADSSGFIRGDEFRAYFRIEETPFNLKLFSLFDYDSSGCLNFLEFVCSMWNFLATESNDLPRFTFRILNNVDYLTIENFLDMLRLVHGEHFEDNGGLRTVVDRFLADRSTVSCADFASYAGRHPVLVGPILRLHLKMRSDFLGEEFWREVSRKRSLDKELSNPYFLHGATRDAVHKYAVLMRRLKNEAEARRLNEGLKSGIQTKAKRVAAPSRVKPEGEVVFNADKLLKERAERKSLKIPTEKRRRKSLIKPDFSLTVTVTTTSVDDERAVLEDRDSPQKRLFLETHQFKYVSDDPDRPASPIAWTLAPDRPASRGGSPWGSPRNGTQNSTSSHSPAKTPGVGRHNIAIEPDPVVPTSRPGSRQGSRSPSRDTSVLDCSSYNGEDSITVESGGKRRSKHKSSPRMYRYELDAGGNNSRPGSPLNNKNAHPGAGPTVTQEVCTNIATNGGSPRSPVRGGSPSPRTHRHRDSNSDSRPRSPLNANQHM